MTNSAQAEGLGGIVVQLLLRRETNWVSVWLGATEER